VAEEEDSSEPKKPRQRIEDLELFSVIAPTGKSEKREHDRVFREVLTRLTENDKTLRRLALHDCRLKERRLVDLSRAVATNTTLLELDLSSRGLHNTEQIYPLLKALKQNRSLRYLNLMYNGINLKTTKAIQAAVQINYGLVRLDIHEKGCKMSKDKTVIEILTNIEWYLQSNRNFLNFLRGTSTELNMCGRSIPSLEGMTFRHVTAMNMSHNYLTKLPTSISSLTQLVVLNLSHNDLIALPSAIGQLESLEKLDCSFNSLSTLPESMDKLSKLTHLNVESNQLKKLPRGLLMLNIETLMVGNNRFKIPKKITKTQRPWQRRDPLLYRVLAN